ncbi:ABC transporter substrate-binding protein [Emcibacter sp. SYSU 3D8]|uniref:MlaC/ttg2D family ABC transporter substrate-binding protein n=1 Tax=Emcibacter sp. SYSU 3D8 TaxID=3133969 RepID=UPI0031FEA499
MKSVIAALLFAALFVPGARAEASLTPGSAQAAVDELQTGMIGILKKTSGQPFDKRVDALCPVLEARMDVKLQSAMAIGRSVWNSWSDEQRTAYVAKFKQYLCAIYASRFKSFTGQTLAVTGERPGPSGAVIVNSEVRIPQEASIPIDYVMRKTGETWKVSDLYLGGRISEIALRRSEFANVLRTQGFDGLIAAIGVRTAAQGGK